MNAPRNMLRMLAAVPLVIALVMTGLFAQRGGRGGGGGDAGPRVPQAATRMAALTAAFTLDEDQKKQVKTIFDDGYKNAAPLRQSLEKSRTALGLAIQSGKSQAVIDDATQVYAKEATAMMQAEIKALARFVQVLTPEQRANQNAMQSATYMMRGIFVWKKWDTAPDVYFY